MHSTTHDCWPASLSAHPSALILHASVLTIVCVLTISAGRRGLNRSGNTHESRRSLSRHEHPYAAGRYAGNRLLRENLQTQMIGGSGSRPRCMPAPFRRAMHATTAARDMARCRRITVQQGVVVDISTRSRTGR